MKQTAIDILEARGFTVTATPFQKNVRISCNSCAASAINGMACHETGCPAERWFHECSECDGGEWLPFPPITGQHKRHVVCDSCREADYYDSLMDYGDE